MSTLPQALAGSDAATGACLVCTTPGDYGPPSPKGGTSGVCPKCIAADLHHYRPLNIKLSPAMWIRDMHRSAIQAQPDQAMQITDEHIMTLIRVKAERSAEFNGWSLDKAVADETLSAAIGLVAQAIALADDKSGTFNALLVALTMQVGE
ncbi:hypothetical protein ACFOSC_26660 [Streptantibioticus rubrisoli]|uniref:Uncharacterized protein n=1 Tax=Streptantibioticus rubrisoli TaxID=1387313 RepID=A0ABT1PHX7_9ACTN|nr:hypothetical protein [Streptantibioticus rubrisoli]MCQ4043843.1 hypothetical protein [Streptantibioticus rubrisoli]